MYFVNDEFGNFTWVLTKGGAIRTMCRMAGYVEVTNLWGRVVAVRIQSAPR